MHWLGLVKQHLQQDIWLLGRKLHDKGEILSRFFLFFVRLFLIFFSTSFFCFLSPNVCIHCCLLGYRIVRDERGRG
jgi:hypothetical protein